MFRRPVESSHWFGVKIEENTRADGHFSGNESCRLRGSMMLYNIFLIKITKYNLRNATLCGHSYLQMLRVRAPGLCLSENSGAPLQLLMGR